MAKGYWVSVYRAISDPERLAAYNQLARAAARVKFSSCASTRKYRRLTVSGATCPPCRLITSRSASIAYRSFPRPHIKP